MLRSLTTPQEGFTLVETLVALALIIVSVIALGQLFLQGTSLMLDARRAPVVLAAAESKIEQLRALPFRFDAAGAPFTDASSDTSHDPPLPSGGTGLQLSPAGSLDRDVEGFVDYLDAYGGALTGRPSPRGESTFTRRWSIAAVGGDADLIAIRSCVWRTTVAQGQPAACVATVRARRP